MYRAPADVFDDFSILRGADDCGTATVALSQSTSTLSAACRRLQFDDDVDDADCQKSSRESSEAVSDYTERLYNDQVARWNIDFKTLTPLNGGRWRWTRVTTSPSLQADECVTAEDSCCSKLSQDILTKKRKSRMNDFYPCKKSKPAFPPVKRPRYTTSLH